MMCGLLTAYANAQTISDDRKYEGEVVNGKGTLIWSDGRKYAGQYKDDERNGKGTEYDSSGKIIQQGIFRDDEFVGG